MTPAEWLLVVIGATPFVLVVAYAFATDWSA